MGVMGEIVLAFPEPIAPVRHVRSTLLHGGLASLKAGGHYDAYVAAAPIAVREEIESAVAGMWIPVQTAVAHYLACDAMGLSAESAAQLGRGTFDRTKGLLLGTAIGVARTMGVTPMSYAPHLQRFWLRGLDGGGLQAVKTGPKELRIDVVGCPLLRSTYFRAGLRGLTTSLFELVSRKVYVQEVPGGGPETAIALRAQWV
jgi:hypothetical protein